MLDQVNCKVLSTTTSDTLDAYLLSESSMFVWQHKMILKTCGTTTLLLGLTSLLEIAARVGFPSVHLSTPTGVRSVATPYRVFYSRKNFLFPQRQHGPHKSWRDEVAYLDEVFSAGDAYLVGKMNSDHWYLYITKPNLSIITGESTEVTPTKPVVLASGEGDETLEILMTDLDPENAQKFYAAHAQRLTETAHANHHPSAPAISPDVEQEVAEGHARGSVIADTCGLSALYPPSSYPGATVSAFTFEPCGFSANGVIPGQRDALDKAGHYWTVHVTPEAHCSYASFESNVPGRPTMDVIAQVVGMFKPGRFSVTRFEGKGRDGDEALARTLDGIAGYRKIDRIVYEFEGYDFVFGYYEKAP